MRGAMDVLLMFKLQWASVGLGVRHCDVRAAWSTQAISYAPNTHASRYANSRLHNLGFVISLIAYREKILKRVKT